MLKIIKRIIGCFIIIAAIIILNQVLVYILVDDAENEVRYAMHELYQQENIDTLVLGSSHVFCGYDPRILDEVWGENTYLAATPVQKIDGSYYLLKEVIKKNDLKTVYIDAFYRHYRDIPKEREDFQMEYIYCVTDYMENNWNRFEFLVKATGYERYADSFLIPSRYGNYLLDLKRFERVIKSKRSDAYVNYDMPESLENTFYKGAMFNVGQSGNPNMVGKLEEYEISPIKDDVISEYSLDCLDKIVKLCKEENIRLVLVTTPFSDLFLKSIGNYDVFYNYMRTYAQKNEIEFYDFNLCKTDVLEFQREDFTDTHHLSGVGNAKYSKVFAEVMSSFGEDDRNALFYDSVEEKMKALPEQILGVTVEKNSDGSEYRIDTVANYEINAEYRISIIDDEGNESELIQEFNENDVLRVKQSEVRYKITARDVDTKEVYEEIVVSL